jgi:hypothetical protein
MKEKLSVAGTSLTRLPEQCSAKLVVEADRVELTLADGRVLHWARTRHPDLVAHGTQALTLHPQGAPS